jgi:predicted small secreted protein
MFQLRVLKIIFQIREEVAGDWTEFHKEELHISIWNVLVYQD